MPATPAAATAPANGPQIKSRKPTGEVPLPLILLSGDEKAGKSLVPVVLSRSKRIGAMYWIDLGEGTADEYAILPGADYEVIEHDGTYRDILEQVTAIWHEAARAARAGEPPVAIVVDSASAEWTMLVNWTNDRARRSRTGQKKLRDDPDAEIDPTSNLWNDATKRHYRLMNLLMTFPGLAIVTARGKDVMVMGPGGQPTTDKVRKPEGQKGLAYDVDAWIWMTRETFKSDLMGVRSLRVSPGDELPTTRLDNGWEVLDLDAWVFDVLGATSNVDKAMPQLRGDDMEGLVDLIASAPSEEDLQAIWQRVKPNLTPAHHDEVVSYITTRLEVLRRPVQDDVDGLPADPATPDPDEPSLAAHGPDSDAEKLRAAAEARRAQDATAEEVPA
jgi:hypothetical protein